MTAATRTACASVRSLADDLARRDFTINAMAMDLSGTITDLFGGREDLARGVIRCVGDAETRFREDALRMLRARRFAAQLGFCAGVPGPRRPSAAALALRRPLPRARAGGGGEDPAVRPAGALRPDAGRGLLAACLAPQSGRISPRSPVFPSTPEARWTGAKLACPALQPEAFRLPARLCRLVTSPPRPAGGPDRVGWKRLIAAHGWETARLQADMQRTDAVRQIESRGDCVTLRQLAVTGADLPQLCGRDVGRMLQLLLAYVLEHPAENQKTRLLTLSPQLWQRESKNNS